MIARWLSLSILVGFGFLVGSTVAGADAPEIDYSRDIQPILSENCFACHGPDAETRKAGLRLDHKVDAFAELPSGSRAIVPGQPDESELVFRIEEPDESVHMPPAKSGKSLTTEQIALIRRWIEQGAPWSEHWAFVPPHRPEIPQIDSPWVRNPVDAFVLERLNKEGLDPSPEADRVALIRRLSLDLTGLPPTPEEVEAFVNDGAPGAYERLVDRLLDSPHYGEHWARFWLDAARYADSDGYEKDKPRFVWFYRDWVIQALNRDLPYDQFIIEQVAGDLLPGATQDQKVATGFLRNSMINEEGGANPEQFRMEAMFDRMDAIGKGVLGLTISCAQCHTHKFDPLTHNEYYQMFAFLNNSDEGSIAVYTAEDQANRETIFRQIHDLESELQRQNPDWESWLASWEDAQSAEPATPPWEIVRPELDESGGQKHDLLEDGSVLASGYAPTKHTTAFTVRTDLTTIAAVRLELLNDPNLPLGGPGRSIEGLCALTEFRVSAAPADRPDELRELKIAHATADVNPPQTPLAAIYDDRSGRDRVTGPVSFAIDGDDLTAWGVDIGHGRSNVPHQAVFSLEEPAHFPNGAILTFHLTQNHGGWNSDDNQNNNLGRFRFAVTEDPDAQADPVPDAVRQVLAIPRAARSAEQDAALFSYWRTTRPEWRETNDRIEALWQEHPAETSQLVLLERDEPRQTRRLERGDFLQPAELVEPGVPAFLNPLPSDATRSRLTFARWLVDRESPTTARAIVNRVWQADLGRGLVATSEDFGLQGEAPSHPELLDWLAVEFMDQGWSLKQLQRLIVTSATYRQSSKVTPESLERDPENRLLGRGPRFRVSAETVRDIALAASGLLNPEVGGPSVHPPAPEFLFQPPASYGPKIWETAEGSDRYRRALYTFRYRSVPYPMLQAFDAPNGDVSCVTRSRSNTPLQALTGLNEPVFLECARALALKTLREAGPEADDRIAFAFQRCVARSPEKAETAVLLELLQRQTDRFSETGANPWDLAADDPNDPPALPEGVRPVDLAAWTAVARVLLNLDETITKD